MFYQLGCEGLLKLSFPGQEKKIKEKISKSVCEDWDSYEKRLSKNKIYVYKFKAKLKGKLTVFQSYYTGMQLIFEVVFPLFDQLFSLLCGKQLTVFFQGSYFPLLKLLYDQLHYKFHSGLLLLGLLHQVLSYWPENSTSIQQSQVLKIGFAEPQSVGCSNSTTLVPTYSFGIYVIMYNHF